MRRKLVSSIVIAVLVGAMTACGTSETSKSGEVQTQETASAETEVTAEEAETTIEATTEAEIEETAEASASFTDIASLLGMKDEDTADLFGGGEENWTADKSFYIGRIYKVSLFDEEFQMYTTCDDEKTVNVVSVWIASDDREVTAEETKKWTQRLTEFTGAEPSYNKSEESGSQNWKWMFDGKTASLHWLGNTLSFSIQPAVGELK